MSIINQASKRLEQLRQAGVELPWADGLASPQAGHGPASADAAGGLPSGVLPPAPVVAPSPPAPSPFVPVAPTVNVAPLPAAAAVGALSSAPAGPHAPAAEPSAASTQALHSSVVPMPTKHVAAAMPAAPAIATAAAPSPAMTTSAPAATADAPIPAPAPTPSPAPAVSVAVAATASAGGSSTRAAQHSDTIELDLPALAQRKLLVPGCDDRGLINEFRAIKRPLVTNALGKNAANVKRGNVIVVTSAMPGEGKTYCAINLALSMAAQVDNTVLLIDADVVKPALSKRLGLPPTLGLLDLLSETPRPVNEVLLRTNLPKLALIASSAPRPDSAERISSDRMEALIDEMAKRYPDRIIVIDAPPLLLTNESRVLASLAGQVVMVVEAGRTTRRAVHDAFQAVESCPVVMSILNKRSQAMRGYGYGYGYGDGY